MKPLIPFIIIAVCIAAYFLYISPALVEVQALSASKAQYSNVLEKTKELKNKRESVDADYNNISGDNIARLNKIIPEKFDGVLFINDLNSIAGRYGLSVRDLKVNESKTEVRDGLITDSNDMYRTSAVTFVVHGQYSQFIRFLNDLETSLRLVDVTAISIKNGSGKSSTDAGLDYSLEVQTYSLR